MLDPVAYDTMRAFCQATYQLLADPDCGSSPEWSLVVAAGPPLAGENRLKLCASAARTDTDIVYLEFGHELHRGPQRVQLIMPRESLCFVYSDCAFWADKDQRPLRLFRRDDRASHFMVMGADLIHVPSRVSGPVGSGLNRAAHRLRNAARHCLGGLRDDTFAVQL